MTDQESAQQGASANSRRVISMKEATNFRTRFYERYASTQATCGSDLTTGDALRTPYFDRLIRRHFPSSRATRIVDLGCGDGALMAALVRHGYLSVRGVDTSPEQVERAHARGIDVVCGDVAHALDDMSAESQDVIVAFDVLEHFSKEEILSIVESVHRVLSPGGSFVVHVPNGAALFGAPSFFSDLTHETCFTPRSMQQLMSVVGFSQTRLEEDRPTVHGLTSGARWLLWQVLRSGARLAVAVETGQLGGAVFSQNLLAVATK